MNKLATWIVFHLCVSVAASSGFVFPLGNAQSLSNNQISFLTPLRVNHKQS